MPTIDLGNAERPPAATTGPFDALPQRVTLTLPELQLAAELAGGAPLPFELTTDGPGAPTALEGRLGDSPATTDHQAWSEAIAGLRNPRATLTRRGLLTDDRLDPGVAGAVGLLATPDVAVDIDLAVGPTQVRAWHRQCAGAVATLATSDAVVFELAWLTTSAWPAELARVARPPEHVAHREPTTSAVPDHVVLPYALADAAAEAAGVHRTDLVDRLAAEYAGAVFDGLGRPLERAAITAVLTGLSVEAGGRLRVLVARVGARATRTVGVRSWTLLDDGWRSIRPAEEDPAAVRLSRVAPDDLAGDLAPVLSEALA